MHIKQHEHKLPNNNTEVNKQPSNNTKISRLTK